MSRTPYVFAFFPTARDVEHYSCPSLAYILHSVHISIIFSQKVKPPQGWLENKELNCGRDFYRRFGIVVSQREMFRSKITKIVNFLTLFRQINGRKDCWLARKNFFHFF